MNTMRKGHIDAFHKEVQHLKREEEKVLFRLHRWEVKHKHLMGNLRRFLGVLFGLIVGSYVAFYKLIFLRDAILLTLMLLVLSYLITHHDRRRMFNAKSLIISFEHTMVLYLISVVLVAIMFFIWPEIVESFADMLLIMSTGAFFGSIMHSYA